jgi:pyruvate kinase
LKLLDFLMTDTGSTRRGARELLDEVVTLRGSVVQQGKATFRKWRPRIARPDFAASARNLAHYLAFRRHDLRQLQRRLMALGLSSLGRAESRVLATLDAVTVVLAGLSGASAPALVRVPSERQFFRGEQRLASNTETVFGPPAAGRAGRILVTLGTEAATDPKVVHHLADLGADAVRINCAHDDPGLWEQMVENVHAAEESLGRSIPILMDIGGPKVRTVDVATPRDRDRLRIGDEILLSQVASADPDVPGFRIGCTLPQVFRQLKVGNLISIDDGKLRGHIVRRTAAGLVARIDEGRAKGIRLKAEKGLNFPEVDLGLEPLTERDRYDLDFIVHHADMIGYSFVETADHVAALQAELAARRNDWHRLALVAKIETPRAVRNLPDIIVQAAGRQPLAIMIARGDLAIELGFERVAEMQEEILWLCEAANVPAIWATQVLEGLVTKGLPSRGEMTDAAMAARAECVMLNKGPNVAGGVAALDRLLRRMSEHQRKKTPTLRALHFWAD